MGDKLAMRHIGTTVFQNERRDLELPSSMTQGQPPAWVTYSPLLPLFLLLFTGLYLFVLPYAARWRSGASQQAGD